MQAQILPAPTLIYGTRPTDITRRPGSWEAGKYSLPAKLPAYAVASFADRRGTESALAVSQSFHVPVHVMLHLAYLL